MGRVMPPTLRAHCAERAKAGEGGERETHTPWEPPLNRDFRELRNAHWPNTTEGHNTAIAHTTATVRRMMTSQSRNRGTVPPTKDGFQPMRDVLRCAFFYEVHRHRLHVQRQCLWSFPWKNNSSHCTLQHRFRSRHLVDDTDMLTRSPLPTSSITAQTPLQTSRCRQSAGGGCSRCCRPSVWTPFAARLSPPPA